MINSNLGSAPVFAMNGTKASIRYFIELLKPGVMALVVYTGMVGLYLAPISLPWFHSLFIILCIAGGSGAAAVCNMWYDRDIDALMERTQKRPIPQGKIPPAYALLLAGGLSFVSVGSLYLVSNSLAAFLLAFSIFFYGYIYTVLLKRRTSQNIVIGGAAGAFPPLIGWAAATNSVGDLVPWLLFLIIFLWTPSHFWALALVRVKDYQKAGVPMLPVTAGIHATKQSILIYSFLLVLSSYALVLGGAGSFYLVPATILGGIYLYLACRIFGESKSKESMRLFIYSIFYLFLLFSVLIGDHFLGF